MPDVESNIKINITATQNQSANNINKVEQALKNLKATADQIDGGSIDKVTSSLLKLSVAVSSIDTSKAAALTSLTKGIKDLAGIGDINLNIQGIQDLTTKTEDSVGIFDRLKNAVNGVETALSALTKPLRESDIVKALDPKDVEKTREIVDGVKDGLKQIVGLEEQSEKKEIISIKPEQVQTINTAFSGIKEKIEETKSETSSLNGFIEKINNARLEKIEGSFSGLASSIGKALTPFAMLTTTVKVSQVILSHYATIIKTAFSTIATLGKNVIKIFTKMSIILGKISVEMGKVFGKAILAPLTLLGKALTGIVNKLKSFFSSLVRIATYRLFRSMIKMLTQGLKEGIDNLYQWSKALDHVFAKTMDLYATDKQYLNNSFAAMLEPIIETLVPLLDKLTDKIVDFYNTFNQTLSALAGKSTWTKALKVATEYDDVAADAKKKTEDLKRSLLGFDEINRLDDPDKGKSSKNKKEVDYEAMFKEMPISSMFADFANKLRKLIKDGQWFAAGQMLGNKINELIESWDAEKTGKLIAKKFNEAIDFARGLLTATNFRKLGNRIATLFNGLFVNLKGKNLGRAIADVINSAFNFALGFFEKTDGKTVGKTLSDIINGFFGELSWEAIGQTISKGIKTLLDIGIEYLRNFDSNQLYNGLLDIIRNVQWGEIGTRLAEFLNQAINVINADKIAEIIGNLIQGVATFIKNSIGNLNIGELVTKVINIFTDLLTDGKTVKSLSSAANTLLVKASEAISALISNFPTTEIFNAITTFFNGISFDEIGTNIGTALQGAIDNIKPESIANAISTIINKAIDLLGSLAGKLNELTTVTLSTEVDENGFESVRKETMTYWEKLGYDIGSAVGNGLSQIKWDEATETLNNIATGITTMIRRAIEEADKNGKLSEAIDTVVKGIDWDTIATNLMVIIADVESALHSALWELGKAIGRVIWDAIKDFFTLNAGDFLNKLASLFGVVGKAGNAVKGALTPQQYASGGFPAQGQMFIARESGAEMVGTIGGKTAVANNNDIVTAVSQGVYEAVSAAQSTDSGTSNITVSVDGDNLFNFFVKKHNGTVKQTGVTPLFV